MTRDRRECYTFSASSQKWARIEEATPVGLAFSGMAAHGNCVYIAGGRWVRSRAVNQPSRSVPESQFLKANTVGQGHY